MNTFLKIQDLVLICLLMRLIIGMITLEIKLNSKINLYYTYLMSVNILSFIFYFNINGNIQNIFEF
mgnify:CR=1 FL=1